MKSIFLRSLLAICLCLTVAFNTPITAFAAEGTTVQPRYTYISTYTVYLTTIDGNAHIVATLNGQTGVTYSYIKCNLEKLTGTYWVQMKSFSATGVQNARLSTDYGIDRGTYRVKAIFTCDTETITAYSPNQTY